MRTIGTKAGRLTVVVIAFTALAASAAPALAAQHFAAPSGSASNWPCSTAAAPCDLVSAIKGSGASPQPAPGDEVIVEPGTYTETNTISTPVAEDIHGVTGQPRPTIQFSGISGYALAVGGFSQPSELEHLTVDDASTGSNITAVNSFGNTLIDGLVVSEAGSADSGAIGIDPGDELRDTVAVTLAGDGPAVRLNAETGTSFVVRNVTAINGGDGSGVQFRVITNDCGTGTATASLRNVIIETTGANDDLQAFSSCAETTDTLNIDYSDFDPAAKFSDSSSTITLGSHNLDRRSEAPQFANPTSNDYHEAAGSPTIDAGVNDSADGTSDPDGSPRTIGPATDIGAYEAPEAPGLQSNGASQVTSTSAVLTASANPNFSPTTVTASAGRTVTTEAAKPAQNAGSGTSPVPLTFHITGLTPGATYHFHFSASNALGSATTTDQTFTTPLAPGKVHLPKRAHVVHSKARVELSCSAPSLSCAGKLILLARIRGKLHKVGSARFSLASGQTKTIKVKLSRTVLEQLAAAPGHHVRVIQRIRPAGPSGSLTLTP